jgi:tetratricopeptide (TPR) repeat protein
MAYLSYIHEARELFYRRGNAAEAELVLRPLLKTPKDAQEKRAVHELMGLILRRQLKFQEAVKIYEGLNDSYQAGYCIMLQGQTQNVLPYWKRSLLERNNHWCVSLFGLLTRQLNSYPTLFQIRNHFESDIANLIAAKQGNYLDNMLSYVDFLTQINLETPKFAGRALMHAGHLEQARDFLVRGQKALPNDPEIYFHLGQYSIALQHEPEARLMLKQCLLISPTYRPAKDLLELLPASV